MPQDVEVSKDDPRFAAAVSAVVEQKLPHLMRVEKYLSFWVVVASLLSSVGVLALAAWAGRIFWQKEKEDYIHSAVKAIEADPQGPVSSLTAHLTNMSKTINTTFETQVDSATFKALRFGCTPSTKPEIGFPVCANTTARAGLLQAVDDQTVLLVANPSKQIVKMEIAAYPIDRVERLEPLLLQIYAEPPPIHATASTARTPLPLKVDQIGPNGAELLQDGRIRLVSSLGPVQASLDLTPSLAERAFAGPILLRFVVVKERAAAGSSPPANREYEPASGTELFFLRTLTFAYHKIPVVANK